MNSRKTAVGVFLAIAAIIGMAACGGGGGGGAATTPVSVNALDGATNIPTGSTFQYTFSSSVDTATVDTSTYFIVPTPAPAAQTRAAIDETVCDPTAALEAVVSCPNFTQCTLDPAGELTGDTDYSICLTTGIDYLMGDTFSVAKQFGSFEGFMAQFTTGAGESGYTIGGTVAGLDDGESVVLQNNASDDLAVSANGAFTFATALADGAAYAVTVATAPEGKACTVGSGTGTVAGANVTDVAVTCSYTVGGTVGGLIDGRSLVLQNNGGDDLTVSADGSFAFATGLADGAAYAVTILTQPDGQTCTVTDGTGTVAGAGVTDVMVACEPDIIAGYLSRWTLSGTLADSGTAGNDLTGRRWIDEGEGEEVAADFTTYSTTVKKAGPSSAQLSDDVYMRTTNDPFGEAPDAFSIALWIYPATGIGDDISAFYNASGFRINYNAGNLEVGYLGHLYTVAIDLDTWTHVVFTYVHDGTDANLYFNGARVAGDAFNFSGALTSTQWMGQGWVGYLDDVVLYDTELSAAQVAELYGDY